MKLYNQALTCALNAYLSDWDEFEGDPQGALADLAAGADNVSIWAPLEFEDVGELCDAVEALAADILNTLNANLKG